jgi:DNA-binding response OmpR family regulator
MRVLVIEDEPRLALHITRALARHAHCATAQYDGAKGLQAALADAPDLVILDLSLPTLDGMSVLAGLREAHCPARVLILTARGAVGHRVQGLKAGADDYLVKPFSMEELMARIEALLRSSSRGCGKKWTQGLTCRSFIPFAPPAMPCACRGEETPAG